MKIYKNINGYFSALVKLTYFKFETGLCRKIIAFYMRLPNSALLHLLAAL